MDSKNHELREIEQELITLTTQREIITRKINKLQMRCKELKTDINLTKSLKVDEKLSTSTFKWSEKIQKVLEEKFQLNEFRFQQLSAINATLSKKDVLLLMPTGGGKTLCYQLPALIEDGMTLVVSPLLALMEDQLINLRKLNVNALAMSSKTPKDIKDKGFKYMNKGEGTPIKLMYVTPEWLAKSKRFMSALQKLHESKKLNRIAIDEVHCCSQWGHDFRPDYKYLGLLKGMFPNVPIIGLTATATTNVLTDIQSMLDMPNCIIIRAPFDRPNLNFKVMSKPEKMDDCYDLLRSMLLLDYHNQSGIIYTATIKDCEEVAKSLRAKGLKVCPYHAELDEEFRVKTHNKWLENKIQVVVATVAFGMGIDKPDVRFVVHFSIPKSMETLYQESGRAGRNGMQADCIVLFKLGDYLKNSGYARSKVEVKNALSVLEYCLDIKKCRHYLIGLHFEETEIKSCKQNCDNCTEKRNIANYDAESACTDLHRIISISLQGDKNLTLPKLLELWLKGSCDTRKPNLSKELAERVIGNLIVRSYIKEEKSYTPYAVICYLRVGYLAESTILSLPNHQSLDDYLKRVCGEKRKHEDIEFLDDDDD